MKSKKHSPARPVVPAASPKTPVVAAQSWVPWAVGMASLIALFWAYGPAMHAPFLFDDMRQRFAMPAAADPLRAWIGPVRPVLMFTYWMNTRISMEDTTSYHLFNILIHALTGLFVWLGIRRLLEWAGVEAASRAPLAAFGALLFLLHPLQTESVAYISGRSESLSGMFAAASFAAFVCRRRTAISWPVTVLVVALFGAAFLSKEQAVALPLLFLLTDFWWNPGFSLRGALGNWKLYAMLAGGAALAFALVWQMILGHNTGNSAGFGLKDFTWYQYLFTEFRVFFAYAGNFVLPVQLNVDWDFPISHTVFEHGSVIFLVILVALAGLAWRYRKTFPLAGYGYFCFLVLLSPTSSILPIQDPIADRRMYLPSVGLILIALDLLRRVKVRPREMTAGCAVVLVACLFATHARAEDWRDPVALWQDTERKSPEKVRAHFQLAFAYFELGRFDLALKEFEKTASLKTPTADLLLDWGLTYDALHRPDVALEKLQQAAKLDPTPQVYTQIAKVHADNGRYPEALAALDTGEKLDPTYAMTFLFRGKVLLRANRPAEAVVQYQRALALDPAVPDAGHDLAIAQSMLRAGR